MLFLGTVAFLLSTAMEAWYSCVKHPPPDGGNFCRSYRLETSKIFIFDVATPIRMFEDFKSVAGYTEDGHSSALLSEVCRFRNNLIAIKNHSKVTSLWKLLISPQHPPPSSLFFLWGWCHSMDGLGFITLLILCSS